MIPWAYPLKFSVWFIYSFNYFRGFPSFSSCQFPVCFFFPLGTFPVSCLRSTPRLPHPVYPLGELGPLSYMAPGMAGCNTHINDDFITALHYGTQCADQSALTFQVSDSFSAGQLHQSYEEWVSLPRTLVIVPLRRQTTLS